MIEFCLHSEGKEDRWRNDSIKLVILLGSIENNRQGTDSWKLEVANIHY